MHLSLPSPRARRAFTLIELLTVIAIIGILAAILIPTVGRVRESARTSQCSSNMRQVVLALNLYAQDNRNYYPAASGRDANNNAVLWTKEIRPYLPLQGATATSKENAVFVCPSANFNGSTGTALSNTYSATAALLGPTTGGVLGRNSLTARALGTIDSSRISRIPLLVEGKPSSATATTTLSNINWTSLSTDLAAADTASTVVTDFRHSSRMNVGYVDGSVRSMDFGTMKTMDRATWEGVPVAP